jgi:hypothetical protein
MQRARNQIWESSSLDHYYVGACGWPNCIDQSLDPFASWVLWCARHVIIMILQQPPNDGGRRWFGGCRTISHHHQSKCSRAHIPFWRPPCSLLILLSAAGLGVIVLVGEKVGQLRPAEQNSEARLLLHAVAVLWSGNLIH